MNNGTKITLIYPELDGTRIIKNYFPIKPLDKRCVKEKCVTTISYDLRKEVVIYVHQRQGGKNNRDQEVRMELTKEDIENISKEETITRLKAWVKELHDYWNGEKLAETDYFRVFR